MSSVLTRFGRVRLGLAAALVALLGVAGLTGSERGGAADAAAGGGLLVGAAKESIAPRPQAMQQRFPGARWETDLAACVRLSPEQLQEALGPNVMNVLDHAANAGTPWPENPDCIYQGGYGLGPMYPVSRFDTTLGLWVRAMAVSDGKDVLVTTVVDGEGWLWDYRSKCTDCGAKQLAARLAADPAMKARGVVPASLLLHATHSHTSPDFIGGWGFVPDWYMAQVSDTILRTSRAAVLALRPALLTGGSVDARPHNSERRGTYRSAEEQDLSWLRAVDERTGRTIATLGAFAAHPVTQDESAGVAHPDWVGDFARRAEQRFGGVALHVMTGLGNVTGARRPDPAKGEPGTGVALADLIPARGAAIRGDLRLAQRTWQQPITNVPLDALGTPGFFDRRFDATPASVSVGKNPEAPCVSAAPQSVELPVTVARIGTDLAISTGPGELFSNLTNTLKEKSSDRLMLPFAQTNDALGYMPQSFEINPVGQQGLGFGLGGYLFVNYEDSYAIDRCVGDMALETTLDALADLP